MYNEYKYVQQIAKDTMAFLQCHITAGMRLLDIRSLCEEKMLALGADSFWYWDIGAFVFAGDETAKSVSGRTYTTSDRVIAADDIITIDLSPQIGHTWGDYARTLILQNGHVADIKDIKHPEWKQGLLMEDFLHNVLLRYAKPDTTYDELYHYMNGLIEEKGFINLDFAGNLGHSIALNKEDRIYIEKGNHKKLGDTAFFTFEPHISRNHSVFGYKKENIYFYEHGILQEL